MLGDIKKIKALIVMVEKATTSRGSDMLKIKYSAEDRIEHQSVMFENNAVCLPDPAAISNSVCELTIEDSSYNGKPSTKILGCVKLDGEDIRKYVRMSKVDGNEALAAMRKELEGDADLWPILSMIVFDNKEIAEKLKAWPAAHGHHHAFMGGLLEHVYMMFRNSVAVLKSDVVFKDCDKGVVLAAIVLHDIGKIYEYDFEPGIRIKTSIAGNLLGHIPIADSLVIRACAKKNIPAMSGRVLQVRHCILSHHGKKEWGSPVVPSTLEAVFVHQMDMLNSRGEMAIESIEPLAVGEMKDRDERRLDGAFMFKWRAPAI